MLSDNNNIILTTKYIKEIQGEFHVPSYQRGYRWGKDEVLRLLDDIYQNGKNNYCLQPVVVCKNGETYDLIDGQQRLTTIYLIYKYMNDVNPMFFPTPAFSLTYKTRIETADYLKDIDFDKQEDNIDFWFIANAYKTIKEWFEQELQLRTIKIFEYFQEDVQVIWYEADDNEGAIPLFTRLNIGKIPLTSAELVKAMFLSSGSNEKSTSSKQDEISLQWDNIEKELHNDSLWYFLSNSIKHKYQTRIDLVLDLISNKPESTREKYYTFFKFDDMRKEISLEDVWRKIQQTFLVLKDWYENHELYHKIGYLIASKSLTLNEIFKASENITKDDFKASLDNSIKESVVGDFSAYSYEKPAEYDMISRLLLLFNVVSVMNTGENTQWFPFDKFKYNEKNKITWSLEHIHAQRSEGMKTQEVWKNWIEIHLPSVKAVDPNNSDLISEMEKAINKVQLSGTEFEVIRSKVTDKLSTAGSVEYMHRISNLALLNTSDNSALNNATFDVKRNKIIERDKEGLFIPFCTKMVFLKYYTPSADSQLHFWGDADRKAYIAAINDTLEAYLETPIII